MHDEDYVLAKRQFYENLGRLTGNSDSEDDPGRTVSENVVKRCRLFAATRQKPALPSRLSRSASDPQPSDKPDEAKTQQDWSLQLADGSHTPATLVRRHTTDETASPEKSLQRRISKRPLTTSKPATSIFNLSNKRRRGVRAPVIAEALRIFRDLIFFFVPNNDIHPGRRLRIAKAAEYGALWQKEWDCSITHIVVDKSIDYGLLLRFLKVDRIPSSMILVNETYPADCIAYRHLVSPFSPQYMVKGAPGRPAEHNQPTPKEVVPPVPPLATSLRLKDAKRKGDRKNLVSQTTTSTTTTIITVSSLSKVSESPQVSSEIVARPETVPSSSQDDEPNPGAVRDEFSDVIEEARLLQDLPLDDEEEEEDVTGHISNDITVKASNAPASNVTETSRIKQDTFQCMHKHTGRNEGLLNLATIEILQRMADYYDSMGDEWRTRAYRKAISALRRHPEKVCTRQQAAAIPQIGERIAIKIEEIALTNRLRRLDSALAEPNDQIFQRFMKIFGVGLHQAQKWVAAGFVTLQDLLDKAELTPSQRIGVEHYDDFALRIPRAEVEQLGTIVKNTMHSLNAHVEIIIGGSYRRGAESSGDIDCIVTSSIHKNKDLRSLVFEKLLPALKKSGFVTAELTTRSRNEGSKWHGACQLPSVPASKTCPTKTPNTNPWRRIDFLVVPADELGAALIYFTGNDIFNRSMRLLASKKGMRLNQRGLYKDVMRGPGRVKMSEGTLIEGRDEKKIFAALGVPWRPPEHRVC